MILFPRRLPLILVSVVAALAMLSPGGRAGRCADWKQFRGNNADGLTSGFAPKSLEKTAWTAPLPGRGISGPIVVSNRVYVTASSGHEQERLHVLAFDAQDGRSLWDRQFWATGRTQCHPKMAVASSTPASDGERIVALYSSNDLACLDAEGKLLWFRGLTYEHPNATNSLGMASSPLVVDGTVIVQIETDDESFAMGIDIENGKTRWKLDRSHNSNWTSPVIVRQPSLGGTLAVLQSAKGLAAVRPRTGEIAWKYDDGAATIPSSAVEGTTLYVPSHGLTAISLENGQARSTPRWRKTQISPGTPSPISIDGRVYTITGGPILVVADAASGEIAWRLRLTGTLFASPVAAGNRMYVFNDSGLGQVIALGDKKGRIQSARDFKESILGTPAIADGALYIRSDQHLWKIVD